MRSVGEVRLNTNRITRLQGDIEVIRRLGCLGARAAAIALKLGGQDWSQSSVSTVLRDYLGKGGAPGRRSTGTPSEMSRRHSEHATLFHQLYAMARTHSTQEALLAADAYEVYHYVARHLDEAKVNVEAAMFLVDMVNINEIKTARCRRCSAPRLIPQHNIMTLFTCPDCEQASRRDGDPGHREKTAKTA